MPVNTFKQLLQIPRPSGKEERVVEFIERIAKDNDWSYKVDDFKNILITKKTKQSNPLLLQAHTDMVCVAEPNHQINFETDGIIAVQDEGFIKGYKTSLGADNGVGVALALAILKEDFPMNIEVVFTSEEETTMNGAKNFNVDWLKSKHMLNLDGTIQGQIDASSASSTTLVFDLGGAKKSSILNSESKGEFNFEVSGLLGGHSGVDVDKNLGHAFKIMLDFLDRIGEIDLIELNAASLSNELATTCNITFATSKSKHELNLILKNFFLEVVTLYNAPNLKLNLKTASRVREGAKSHSDWSNVFKFLNLLEFGALKQNNDSEVILSSNLFEIDLKNSKIWLNVRANHEDLRESYIMKLNLLADAFSFNLNQVNFLPGFTAKKQSRLIALAQSAGEKVFGKTPKISNMHAGVECGIFASKIDGLDACVIGANIENLHSVKERVEVESIKKTYSWLKEIVKNFD